MDRGGRGGLGHLARLPPGRSDSFQAEIFPGGGHVSPAALAVLQENADRARLRREAERAVYMVYSDKLIEGSPKNSTSSVPIMPWGANAQVEKCGDWIEG